MKHLIELLQEYITNTNNLVFLGGAGVSTESGIPDFRSSEGIYVNGFNYPAETILSHSFFFEHTAKFYQFYKKYILHLSAKPNITHYKLTKLEQSGKLKNIVTQNIDGLHQKAGSINLLELHGCIQKNHCIKCNKMYPAEYIFNSLDIPLCACGSIIKPDIVLYEESLDHTVLKNAINTICNADMLIVAGTSLTVYPAAGLINYFNGRYLILINRSSTPYDRYADLIINDNIGEVFSKIILE